MDQVARGVEVCVHTVRTWRRRRCAARRVSRPTDARSPAAGACDGAIRLALDFLGKRWNGVILATLAGGRLGFADVRRAVDGISDSVLAGRRTDLAAAGLVERIVDPGPPVAVSYGLSDAGRAPVPTLEALAGRAEENLPGPC